MNLAGMRIVVTGGHGFLGSHLADTLREAGCSDVFAPRSAEYDLIDPRAVAALYEHAKPDLVFHLAARVGGIGANQHNPGTYFHDNLLMGANVLEQARRKSTTKVVMVGTVCSYPKYAQVPFREEELWAGYPEETNAPYGIAKKALIVMADAYKRQFGLNSAYVLPANLYGPRDNFDLESSHVIPAMIRKFVEALEAGTDRVVLWGDGSPTREFLYVDDCARALRLAAERMNDPTPINIGTGREISIRELATRIARIVGYRGELHWDAGRPNGQPRRMLDTSRARELLGFEAKTSLESGLTRTIAWYLSSRGTATRGER